jgi:daunorubicin resistance ABC transporter membrane protein
VSLPGTVTAPVVSDPLVPAIVGTGLRKHYPGVVAVAGVDLTVAQGEMLALLGPNGAGKTTLIAMLCALAEPTSGSVQIAGHDTRTHASSARGALGLIFQETTLDEELTASENLRFHADLYQMSPATVPARIRQALSLVELTAHRDRLVRTFSGGMRRRLEIGRALLHQPRILILDEPTTGLDPQTRTRIWRHLHQIRAHENIGVLLTTHYLDEAEQCDRIAILDAGRIVAEGTPRQLVSVLESDRIDLRTGDDAAAIRLLHERLGLTATPGRGGLTLSVPDGTRVLPQIFAELGVPIYEAKVTAPSLDDVFLHYTGHWIRDDSSGPGEPADVPACEPPPSPAPSRIDRGRRPHIRQLRMICQRELLHFLRDRTGAVIALLQPLVFLLVLGVGLAGLMPQLGGNSYQLFLFSGILLMAAQAPAISVGSSIIWDRQAGFLRHMLASPARRSTLLIGKCLGGATVATCQTVILLTVAGVIGIPYNPVLIASLVAEITLIAFVMTVFGVLLATLVRLPRTFGTIMSVFMMPLTFLSGSMFPLSAMPGWMAGAALANPLTYAVDAMRRTIAGFLPHPPGRLFHPVTWGSWPVPVTVELLLLTISAFMGLTVAARRFSRYD